MTNMDQQKYIQRNSLKPCQKKKKNSLKNFWKFQLFKFEILQKYSLILRKVKVVNLTPKRWKGTKSRNITYTVILCKCQPFHWKKGTHIFIFLEEGTFIFLIFTSGFSELLIFFYIINFQIYLIWINMLFKKLLVHNKPFST